MKTQSADSYPDAEEVQIVLLRAATMEQRVRLARSLSQTALRLAWQALREANRDAGEDELSVKFVAVHYGEELAAGFREHLRRRRLDG
jgi:hypothetical protein